MRWNAVFPIVRSRSRYSEIARAVNGPGEAREADIGIAGGDGVGLLFKKGEIVRKVPEDKLVDELVKEVEAL